MSYYKYILFTLCSFAFWITNGNLILINLYVKQSRFSDLLCTEGKVSSKSNTRAVFRCAKDCALSSSCVSFFYNQNGPCQLHNISLYNTSLCIEHLDTFYYVRKVPETTTTIPTAPSLSSIETTTLTVQTSSRQLSCDHGWLSIGTGCYLITPPDATRQTWQNATEICKTIGGYLAAMETAKENQLLKEYVGSLGATSKDYFIGGSDLQTDGTFIWEHSGDLINLHGNGLFHDWMSIYQPDNTDDLHCMVLYGQASHMWNDVSCTYAREFICEKDP